MAITDVGTYQDFSYTGGMQEIVLPNDGLYKLEVWGGSSNKAYSNAGGNGGYSVGYKKFNKGTKLYICVGGQGQRIYSGRDEDDEWYRAGSGAGGYNGGGSATVTHHYSGGGNDESGGGGATHIARVSGTLANIGKTSFDTNGLIVAGGGGGYGRASNNTVYAGGTGGGLNGGSSGGAGGTQTSGYAFGRGENTPSGTAGSGGGGGYYGGREGHYYSGGGGGSGWIGGVPAITFKGVTYSPSTSNGQRSGNGLARITFVAKSFPTIYLCTTPIDGAKLGESDIDDIFLGENPLA